MKDIPADVEREARAIAGGIANPDSVMRYTSLDDAARSIALALLEARAEGERRGIERAVHEASVVRNVAPFHEDYCRDWRDGWEAGERDTAKVIENAIRALPVPEPAKEKA